MILREVALQQLLVGIALQGIERLVVLLNGVAADVVVVDVVGGGNDIERGGGGIVDLIRVDLAFYLAIGFNPDAALGLQTSLDALLFDALDNGSQFVDLNALALSYSKHIGLQLGIEMDIELQLTFFAGRQAYDDGMIGLRGKDGTFVTDTIVGVGGGGQRIGEVQLATIVGYILMAQRELDGAQRQETHAVRTVEEILIQQLMSLFLATHQRQVAHLLQMLKGLRAVVVVG